MKAFVREHLERKMAESPKIEVSLEALKELIAEARRLDPIEEKKQKEEVERERRRSLMHVEMAKVEEQRRERQKNGCSHSRYPMSAGKLAGENCPRGQGEWLTSGQLHTDGTATTICQRCSNVWHWRPTPQEFQYIIDQGMLGMAPPQEERLIAA